MEPLCSKATGLADIRDEEIVEAFRRERESEYLSFLRMANRIRHSIDGWGRQTAKTYAQLRRIEAEVRALADWLASIRQVDFFAAPSGLIATDVLNHIQAALLDAIGTLCETPHG